MKNPLSKSRLAVALATVAVCGATFAAVSPLVLPWQGMSPKVEQHEAVLIGVGHFEGSLSMNIQGLPEPMKFACQEVVEPVGELWTVSRFETTFMGMPFTGSGALGYDPSKQKYIGTWIDSTNTSLITMEGVFDEELDAIVMEYDAFDPPSGRTKRMRSVLAQTEDGYTRTFYNLEGDVATQQMEITMKRKAEETQAEGE